MEKSMNRREWLKSTSKVALAVAVAPLVFAPLAEAGTLASKASVHYQGTPSGSNMCSNCANFVPGSNAKAMGTCKLVAGAISPEGYCYDYVPS